MYYSPKKSFKIRQKKKTMKRKKISIFVDTISSQPECLLTSNTMYNQQVTREMSLTVSDIITLGKSGTNLVSPKDL